MSMNPADLNERFLEIKNELAERCAQDSAFRNDLISSPNATVEKEYGLDAGALKDINMNIVVEEPGSVVVPIPPDMSEVELTDEQLDQVAGGAAFIGAVGAVAGAVGAAVTAGQFVERETRAGRRW